jgi:hypothetical protein
MSYCCVPCCTGRGGHRFPSDKELRAKWSVAVRRQALTVTSHTVIALEVVCENSGDNEYTVEHKEIESKCSQTDYSFVSSQCSSTQTANKEAAPFLCFEQLNNDEQLLHYYTGLESVKKLVTVFATLGTAVNHLNYHRTKTVDFDCISPINQFLAC